MLLSRAFLGNIFPQGKKKSLFGGKKLCALGVLRGRGLQNAVRRCRSEEGSIVQRCGVGGECSEVFVLTCKWLTLTKKA